MLAGSDRPSSSMHRAWVDGYEISPGGRLPYRRESCVFRAVEALPGEASVTDLTVTPQIKLTGFMILPGKRWLHLIR